VEFSLLGGPLHRLGRRLGLVRADSNTVPLGVVLGCLAWFALLPLALFNGLGRRLFSLDMIALDTRLLVVIPLFFLCEALINVRARAFVGYLASSGIVPEPVLPQLNAAIARTRRWVESWRPDLLCLVVALLLALAAPSLPDVAAPALPSSGATTAIDPTHLDQGTSLTDWWYRIDALTFVRFLLIRWLLRLSAWCLFLWRVSRLELQLVPTHPDEIAGLGRLDDVQVQFAPLIVAMSAFEAASITENMAAGTMTLQAAVPVIIATVVLYALLFVAPLLVFYPKLVACRQKGLNEYMGLATRYVREFDGKWLRADSSKQELLGTADLQSLADLGTSVSVVSSMHTLPVSRRTLITFALSALLPMLPLLLFKYPLKDLLKQVLKALTGF
jgi:hypothetical protein